MKGELVTIVVCYTASGHYIMPIVKVKRSAPRLGRFKELPVPVGQEVG
jgi:hypothetical protein